MPVRVTTEPTQEPLSLADLKARLQVDHDDDDATLRALLVAARQAVEGWEWRSHLTQTRTMALDRFPCHTIYVPAPPLQSVTSITYVDAVGDEQTLSASLYQVDTASEPGRIVPAYGEVWPVTRCQPNAVTIVYVAGHTDPCDVSGKSKIAITELVRRTYYGTADCEGGMPANKPDWIDVFLDKCHDHRVLEFV